MTTQTILLYGNCQAAALADAFRRIPAITARLAIAWAPSFDRDHNTPARFLDAIDTTTCVCLCEQIEADSPTPDWLIDRLPPTIPRISFPPLDTNLLWPLHIADPRNAPEPALPFGRYPYGDRLVVDLLRRGLTGPDAITAYLQESPRRLPDLDRLAAIEANRLAARDARATVQIADIVAANLRDRRLFWTMNHPTGWLLAQLAARLIAALPPDLAPAAIEAQIQQALADFDPLAHEQMPIHPEVARRLALTWCDPAAQYRLRGNETADFEEYLRRYVDFQ